MSDEDIRWIARVCLDFDAVLFLITGRYGAQPLLMPRSLIYGRTTTLHKV